MKKQLFLLLAIGAIFMTSCKDDEETAVVENLVVNAPVVQKNVVTFSASADNAISYAWNFGNGETGTGASVEASYAMAGKYMVKVTASGTSSQMVDSVEVEVLEGDPSVYNDVAKLLCGFDDATGESNAVWYWAYKKDADMLFGGAKTYSFEHDSADYSIFDPIGVAWWAEEGPSLDEALNDAYSFKLNKEFAYACDFKADGFILNWAMAYHRHGLAAEQYGDIVTTSVPTSGTWAIDIFDHADYAAYDSIHLAPQTIINGVGVDKSYYLSLKGGAWLMLESTEAKYQILRIDSDTVFLRTEVGLPAGFKIDPSWPNPDWISPGEGEWQYAYLVKNETTPAE